MRNFKRYRFLFSCIIRVHSISIVLSSGRNFFGRICVQHQGGAIKNRFLKIDRFRQLNQFGYICRILKHFFISGYIGLVIYTNGLTNFILLSEGLKVGFSLYSGYFFTENSLGSTSKLINIKLFDSINSVEFFPFSGFKIARGAGVFSYLFSKDSFMSTLKMPSG